MSSNLNKQAFLSFLTKCKPQSASDIFWSLEKAEEYLAARFGPEWMKMPDQKTKDAYPVHGNFVDLENDYTKYMTADHKNWLV